MGRELGAALGCDPDLVEASCLSHDLGHPPFGHNGEQALNEFARDCGGFEGNAQSLRLLTRIEPKRFTAEGSVGLNLTRATLDAATKYPWPRGAHPVDPASSKFGVYEDDRPVFDWVRETAPGTRTCFEAQVMDWADDVAYSVHDVEDGLHAGHIDPNCLHAEPERQEIFRVAVGRYVPGGTDPAELAAALDRLQDQDWWPHGYDGTAAAQARLKDATSQLIGRFVWPPRAPPARGTAPAASPATTPSSSYPTRRAWSARSSRLSPTGTSCSAPNRNGCAPTSASSSPSSPRRSPPAPPTAWTPSSTPCSSRRATTAPASG